MTRSLPNKQAKMHRRTCCDYCLRQIHGGKSGLKKMRVKRLRKYLKKLERE